MEQPRLQPVHQPQDAGIPLIALVIAIPDRAQLPRIAHQHLVAPALQKPGDPSRVRPGLHDHHRLRVALGQPLHLQLGIGQREALQFLPLLREDHRHVPLVAQVHSDYLLHGRSPLLGGSMAALPFGADSIGLRGGTAFSSYL